MPMQHRQQHGEPCRFKPDRQAPGIRDMRGIDQCLHLDQQRPRSFLRGQHTRAGHLIFVLRQKERRRIGNTPQSAIGHRKDAELIDRPEPVFEGTHQPIRRMGIAFKIEDGVDHVLEHPRAGQRAFLGDMADHHDDGVRLLGQARELGCAVAHLCHRPRRRAELIGADRLDRVDHHDFGRRRLDGGDDALEADLGQQRHPAAIEPKAPCAQRHLRRRFFAAHIKHRQLLRQMGQRLQQQRRFADTRITADQHHRARHQTTAEHAIKFVGAGGVARHLGRNHGVEPLHAGAGRKRRKAVARHRRARRLDHRFLERIPGAAVRALAGPAR